MTSIRRTALIWMTAILTVVGIVAFAVAYEIARREAADFLDGQLRQIAVNIGNEAVVMPSLEEHQDPEDRLVIEVWAPTGELLRRTPGAPTLPRINTTGFSNLEAGGTTWRVYQAREPHRTVQIAQQMEVRQEIAASAAIQAGAPILILIPLAWLAIGWSVGQLTARLQRIAQDIVEKNRDSRDPVPATDVPAEIRPLAEAMNGLTNRLRDALGQQKRFVADAAHELRTPLTALQIQIDNLTAQENGHGPSSLKELMGGLMRARHLVEQLLHLARSDEAEGVKHSEDVDLSTLVAQCVTDVIAIADAKNVDLGIAHAEPVSVRGSRPDLALLFGNLIDNAVRYTPSGGVVDVSVRCLGESFVVEVADTGCGVAEADIPRLFDRFFRAAPIDVEGSGLGLSIAAAIAKRHALSIEVANRRETKGLVVRVTGRLRKPGLIPP